MTHFRWQAGHFGDAAGVIRYRTEGIERHDHTGQGQHGGGGDGNAEQAGQQVTADNARHDDQRGNGRGFHGNRQPLDDVGAVTGDRGLSDRDDRTFAGGRIVLGHDDKARRHRQTDQTAIEQGHTGEVEGGPRRDIFKRRIETKARQIFDDRR